MPRIAICAALTIALIGLAVLPSYARPTAQLGTPQTSAYLAIVFQGGAPTASATTAPLPSVTRSATATVTPTVIPSPTATSGGGTPIYTNGQDLWNCGDFATWDQANVVFQANLIDGDPNKLDQDNDGTPCESLPGAP